MGDHICKGSIVKSSEKFIDDGTDKTSEDGDGCWLPFSGLEVLSIFKKEDGDILCVEVHANGHERCYKVNYVQVDK